METRANRRFTILDLMILVSALALGLAYLRWPSNLRYYQPITGSAADRIAASTMNVCVWSGPVAITLTFGALFMGMWPDGDPRRPRLAQPGLAACFAAALCWAMMAINHMYVNIMFLYARDLRSSFELDGYLLGNIGAVVYIVWLLLFSSDRWQRASGWRERVARMMGIYWLLCPMLFMIAEFVWNS